MICPKCGAEYVAGVTLCYDCGVDLVEQEPEPAAGPAPTSGPAPQAGPTGEFALVTVYVTSDPGLLAIAQTMLESARIPVMVEGAAHQAIWGPGPLGLGHPQGPSRLCVASQDAEDAREILADLLREG